MTNIAGVFDRMTDAKRAVSELLDAGFRKENVSLIVSRKGNHNVSSLLADTEKLRILKSGVAGAIVGGILGAVFANLANPEELVVPGIGGVTGYAVAVGFAALAGGLSAALVASGFSGDSAKDYAEEIKRGKSVVIVNAIDERAIRARIALRNSAATIIQA
jgi:uncharacterized membrane protein